MSDMTTSEQLQKWVSGEPVHNHARDECCPDFSCCQPDLMADEAVRKRFARAVFEGDESTQNQMLMMFLGAAFSGKKVHIAGDIGADQ